MTLSRRALISGLVLTSGCAPRAAILLVPPSPDATIREVFVGTSREADPTGAFGTGRAPSLSFSHISVSVPAQHRAGQIELPGLGEAPSAARHFTAVDRRIYPGDAGFIDALGRDLRQSPRGRRDVVLYVHGFNNTDADGIFRIAQIVHDLDLPGATVAYSWPSAAQPLNYAYDRDSALFARDGLEQLLRAVHAAGAEHVSLVAHSLGSLLAMETLRQIAIRNPADVRRLAQAIVLFSPDLDVELFRAQASLIGPLPDPFVIFTSRKDRALRLSARLTGQRARLGNLGDLTRLADLKVLVLDVSAFSSVGIDHFPAAKSPALLRILGNVGAVDTALTGDRSGRTGLFPGTVLTLQNLTAIVLSPASAQVR